MSSDSSVSSLVASFSSASQVLSSGSSSHQQRSFAEQSIRAHFLHSENANCSMSALMEACLSNSFAEQAKVLALVTIRDTFLLRHLEADHSKTCSVILNRLLQILINENTATHSGMFERSLRQCTAVICKLQLLTKSTNNKKNEVNAHNIATSGVGTLINGLLSHESLSVEHQIKAIKLIRAVVGELSNPHGGLSLETHEICHRRFESLLLEPTLRIAVTRISKIGHVLCSQSPHKGTNQMRIHLIPLLVESLWLLQEIVSWDFRWHGNPNVTSLLPKFRPPSSWKSVLLNEKLLEQVNRVFVSFRGEGGVSEASEAFFREFAGLNGAVFSSAQEKSIFISTLILSALQSMNNHNDVWWVHEVVCRGLDNCDSDTLSFFPQEGSALCTCCEMILSTIAVIDTQLKTGKKTAEDVDHLVRAVDNLLLTFSKLIGRLQKKSHSSHGSNLLRANASMILTRLSPYGYSIRVQMSKILLNHAGIVSNCNQVETDDGSTVLNDVDAMESRHHCLGTLGRMNHGASVDTTVSCIRAELSSSPVNLFRLAEVVKLASHLLVQHNSSVIVHRFVPAGIRSYAGTLDLIESLIQIVDQVRQKWDLSIDISTHVRAQIDDPGLLILTQAVSACMISFAKVYADPLCPANDPLCPALTQALKNGGSMSSIINILIAYCRSVIKAGPNLTWVEQHNVSRVVKNNTTDFPEGSGAIDLLESIVRRSGPCLETSQAWQKLGEDIAQGVSLPYLQHNPSHTYNGMSRFSPYRLGKIVEFFCRGSFIAYGNASTPGIGQQLFSRLAQSISHSVNQVALIKPSHSVEPLVLSVIECVRGCLRCPMQRGCGWDSGKKQQAYRLGWASCLPLLGKLNTVASNFTTHLPGNMLVLSSTIRLWAHMLKVYGSGFDDSLWGSLFTELEKLLLMFQTVLRVRTQDHQLSPTAAHQTNGQSPQQRASNPEATFDDGSAQVICQFSNLLIQLLLTQKTILVQAFSKKNKDGTADNSSVSNQIINVCFASVERLFSMVNPTLLHYPKVCERFIGLSCLLVELFAKRLLSGGIDIISRFLSCMEFAASHHDDELSDGALQGMESLLSAAQTSPNASRKFIVTRLTHYVLSWSVKSTTFWSDETDTCMAAHSKLLYGLSMNNMDRQTFTDSVSSFCQSFEEGVQQRLRHALDELFAAGCQDQTTFSKRVNTFAAATRGFSQKR